MQKALLRLFKGVEILNKNQMAPRSDVMKHTMRLGFLFSPSVFAHYTRDELLELANDIKSNIGLSSQQLNASFHKSWTKVRDTNMAQLVLEQMMHYVSTCWAEADGTYDKNNVFVPTEELDIPELDIEKFSFVVIHGYTREEILKKLLNLLESGIALSEDSLADVFVIAKNVGIKHEHINRIKNKEAKIAICDRLELFPEDPTEFLRYAIYKTIGKTLLIKDAATIGMIKQADQAGIGIAKLFDKYSAHYGLSRLSEVFYRFKPIFLAFKTFSTMKPIINKIRKLAVKNHRPMHEDYLNSITACIKNGTIDSNKLKLHLDKVNTFRKVRLAHALNYRMQENTEVIQYKIRNGKSFTQDFAFDKKGSAMTVMGIVLGSIAKDIAKNVEGKTIFIPDHIKYALPATEKQFTGYFPSGTCVTVPENMIVGVHWHNQNGYRVDLDLSLIDISGTKTGWDARYLDDDGDLLFSGDITDAPKKNGATEFFYIAKNLEKHLLLNLNFYNHMDFETPFDIIVAQEKPVNPQSHYMVDPNNVKAFASSKIGKRQKTLGMLATGKSGCRFYFCESENARSRTTIPTKWATKSLQALAAQYRNTIDLSTVLKLAGANVINKNTFEMDENVVEVDIDLSPELLEKDTIINLLT